MLQFLKEKLKKAFVYLAKMIGAKEKQGTKEIKQIKEKKESKDIEKGTNNDSCKQSKDATRRKLFISHGTSPYYWPNDALLDVETMLKNKPEGSFLVREANHKDSVIDISYMIDGHVANMKIDFDDDAKLFSLDLTNDDFPTRGSLQEFVEFLIEKCKHHSLIVIGDCRKHVGLVKLNHPIRRNVTLMDHCKRAIYRDFPDVNYKNLNIPKELKNFLEN